MTPATAEKVLTLTKSIVSENNLTCLMITHNMQSALELGNRTIMMHGGNIIFDAEGEERSKLTVQDLLGKFKEKWAKSSITTVSFSCNKTKRPVRVIPDGSFCRNIIKLPDA